jgi:putative ABC transport system ATP-binding protein
MTEVSCGSQSIISCRHVSRRYAVGNTHVDALRDVSLEVPRNKVVALFGPSGSGKSTLLRLLAAVDRPDEGEILLESISIGSMPARQRRLLRRRTISFVFQEPSHNLVKHLTVREQLVLAAQLRGANTTDLDARLELVGLASRRDHLPTQLSGGEQQRLAVAAAVVGNPSIVLCDEPTAELDNTSGRHLLVAVEQLASAGTTFIIASHDPEVRGISNMVVELAFGVVVR